MGTAPLNVIGGPINAIHWGQKHSVRRHLKRVHAEKSAFCCRYRIEEKQLSTSIFELLVDVHNLGMHTPSWVPASAVYRRKIVCS